MEQPRHRAVVLVIHKTPLPGTQDVIQSSIHRLFCGVSAQPLVMISIRNMAKPTHSKTRRVSAGMGLRRRHRTGMRLGVSAT